MNRINSTITAYGKRNEKILSVYFTAGFPNLNDTQPILEALEQSGVGLVEIGMPFSDPIADGPVIQASSSIALKNGMNPHVLFEQLRGIRETVAIPLVLMGYWNPVLQFGVEAFCQRCQEVGIDGLILPDLPPEIFERNYRAVFERYGLAAIFLISPQTSAARMQYLDGLSSGFLYMVSSAGVTGGRNAFSDAALAYFEKVKTQNLQHACLAGFGIHDQHSFEQASRHHAGAIVGSAFVKMLEQDGVQGISGFVKSFGI